ncbi:type I restriction-modification system subunit M N-terminal domain-containing protein [Stenotrophomonas sp. Marseille-Q5258]|uniref:type I restriction-modification system subunit M N-terminal domain-containing protein n=1 Tax=Stenotrophomonas sp. Marseille-Q5258 TaxID=2972779 RepID=UPI0021C771E0|nr:type I restriction-modification system subunit M N-terminal domain-containing protein [Stenotrophomonas sp. Marseille-Q5258]
MTNEELKRTLWDTANKLRGSVSAAEYKYPVLGMVFLKYVSDLFDAQSNVIRQRIAEPGSDYYIEDEATRKASEDGGKSRARTRTATYSPPMTSATSSSWRIAEVMSCRGQPSGSSTSISAGSANERTGRSGAPRKG